MHCPKCNTDILIPNLSLDIKEKVISTVRKGQVLQAVVELRNQANIDLGKGKQIVFHLTREVGICHRCKSELTEHTKEQICPKCHSLNLNW